MNPRHLLPLLFGILGLLSSLPAHAAALKIGSPFPIAALPLCNDETRFSSVEEFRGKKLMLHLFASW